MLNNDESTFLDEGFLSTETESAIPEFRDANADLFHLAEDVNRLLMRIAHTAMDTAKTNLQSPESVAVRLVLRAAGTFQGAVLLAERGLVADARTLVRSCLEDAFALAALITDPEDFMSKYESDFNGATRRQLKFVTEQKLGDATLHQSLTDKLNSTPKGGPLNPSDLAKGSPLDVQYLMYQRLSNDSAHPSATSLAHHAYRHPDKTGWCYSWQVADEETNAATLQIAIQAILPVAVGIVDFLKLRSFDGTFETILERLGILPPRGI